MSQRRTRRRQTPPEVANEFRHQHDEIVTENTAIGIRGDVADGKTGVRRQRVETQTLLDRLRRREQISESQFTAGGHFLRDWRAARLMPRVTGFYDGEGLVIAREANGHDRGAEALAGSLDGMDRLLLATRKLGPELCPVVIAVCIEERGAKDWARSVGLPADHGPGRLGAGLEKLARHYGC